jgi:hypothetical protein
MQGVEVLREQTEAFISENPTSLVLTRATPQDDGAGGTLPAYPTPLPAQTVRVVPQAPTSAVERRTVSGEVVKPELRVVGPYNFNVQMGDYFTWNGMRVEVVWITDFGYQKIAEVAVR